MTTSNQYKGKKVLIADDDPDFLEQTSLILKNLGFEIYSADKQSDAEALLEKEKFDLAIFDLMMDNHDSGFILSYKAKKINPDLPVIIVSAVTSETGFVFNTGSNEEKSWIKADAFLNKGIRPEQLEKEIKKLL